MRRKHLLAILVAVPALATAQPVAPAPTANAGSNMPAGFYPHSPCHKPASPPKGAPGVSDQAAAQVYNLKVKNFNAKAVAFNACVKTYVDNAQRDIQQIQDIVHAAVTDANAPD